MKCEASPGCAVEATTLIRLQGGNRDHRMCASHAGMAASVAEAMGAACSMLPILEYAPPKLEALGDLESLVKDRTEAVAIFKDIMRHGDHVVGNIIPGAVLHEPFKKVKLYLDRIEGKRPPPVAAPAQVTGEIPAGHELCRHMVPIKYVTCAACTKEQEEMAEAEAARLSAVPVGKAGPGEGTP